MAGGGARADGLAVSHQKRDRALELMAKGLPNSIIAQRLGMRTASVNRIRKEAEETADQHRGS
jgi:DNA-binding NarL/FixJ family response regulator